MKPSSTRAGNSFAASSIPMHIDHNAGPPLFQQVANALRSAVKNGVIHPDSRLPPTRDLARQLGLGRNTIVDAYAELAADGWLVSKGRQGTFVLAPKKLKGVHPVTGPALVERLTDAATGDIAAEMDWRLGQACTQLLPLSAWRNACREAGRHLPPSGYGDPAGKVELRQAVADWLRRHRSVDYHADEIVITNGTGQGMALLASTLLRRGDKCVVEDPGYPAVNRVFQSMAAQVVGIPVDSEGMQVEKAFAGKPPSLIHLTAAHQYPLGGRLSGERRQSLIHAAKECSTLIIENEYDHEFIYSGQNFAPLAASAPDQVVLISTFAKAVSPALRIGFIAAPLRIAKALGALVERQRCHVAWPLQMIVESLLRSGELERHLRRVRNHYAGIRSEIENALVAGGSGLKIGGLGGGLHVVLEAKNEAMNVSFAECLRSFGIAFNTVGDFRLKPGAAGAGAALMAYGHMDSALLKKSLVLIRHAARKAGK